MYLKNYYKVQYKYCNRKELSTHFKILTSSSKQHNKLKVNNINFIWK